MTCYRCFLPDLAGFAGSNCTAPLCLISGESGIRTHGGVSPTHAFQACSLSQLGHLSILYGAFRLYHKQFSFQSGDPGRKSQTAGILLGKDRLKLFNEAGRVQSVVAAAVTPQIADGLL
jgi:hypothetical protein